ncbi:MAG: hypothetical protein LBV70_04615 [Candidatus Adiutrix sp.]|jgi:hypothetical protein|nr:hypothetical protein [Candidatus Adiutrix sp.]
MTAALANLTQVLNQSPQVSALAGGHLAAEEAARREAQAETSQRLRETLARTVQPLEETKVVTAVDPQARRESRRSRPAAPRTGPAPPDDRPGAEAAPGPFEPRPVVDVHI